LQTVGELPLFADHTPRERARIVDLARTLRVAEGTVFTVEGEPGSEVFVVVSGTARYERDGRCVAIFGPGDSFGEVAVLDRGPRTATVVAESPMEVMVFDRLEFEVLLESSPKVGRRMLSSMAAQMRWPRRTGTLTEAQGPAHEPAPGTQEDVVSARSDPTAERRRQWGYG